MRRRIALLFTAAALAAAVPAAAPSMHGTPLSTSQAFAKSCSRGYTKATINGATKCLRRGQFCAHSADRQYRRYGFRCIKFDANVQRYRLT